MAKALKTAAIIVGAVALVVATAGALAPAFTAAALSSIGITATAAAIATGLSLAATGLTLLAAALTPKPRLLGGDPTKWKADPFAGLPYMVGRTLNAGNIVRRVTHGNTNKYETFVTVYSCAGPIQSFDTFFANRTTVSFDGGGNANGDYRHQLYQRTQLGQSPEPAALLSPIGGVPGMDGSSKLSGMAAGVLTLSYDSNATIPFTAEPQPAWIGHGVKCYDPRLDSTYPGGSGPCRALDESTYVWSENPFVHALTWCLGRWQNGKRVIGLGAPIATIDVASYVAGANIADANRWTVGGLVYSRPDTPWTVLKAFLQAAAAVPIMLGGTISCMAETPRVSLATIRDADIVGECSIAATQPRRARINGVVPRYRSEAHDWQTIAGQLIQVADYVTVDGGERTKDVEFPLVQGDGTQAAQLGRYEIENAREFGPITVPLKPAWMNYRVGDCLTLATRQIAPQKLLVLAREIDPASGVVTLTMRSETDGKHAFALGQTGVAPPTASVAPYVVPATAPTLGAWTVAASSIATDVAQIPALVVTGACDAPNADGVIFEYRKHGDASWTGGVLATPNVTRQDITSVTPDTTYDVAVSYRSKGFIGDRLVLGPVTTGLLRAPGTQGLPGAPGADGRTPYVHYAYANSPDGTIDFSVDQPNGRAYEGSYTDFTAADSTNPAAYVWREYKGPPFGMAARGYAVVAGNSVIKTGGANAWDSDAYSTVGFLNGCTLSFTGRGADTIMAGLNTDPTTDVSYTSLDYAWYLDGAGNAFIFESASQIPGVAINGYGLGTFMVDYDGRYVRYFYNGALHRTVDVGAGKTFYFDSSLALPIVGARINDISFTARGAAGVDGRDGLNGTNGTPGAPGADGRPSYLHTAYSDAADGSVNFTIGAPGARKYLGVLVDFVAADSTNPTAYDWALIKGADGLNGADGIPGRPGADGRTPYSHIAYSNAADGSGNFSVDDPAGRTYVGFYSDFTASDSTNPALYTWSLVKGADGTNGANGANGANGVDGFIADTESTTFNVESFSNGTPKSTWHGGTGTITLRKGFSFVIAGVTYSVTDQHNMASLTLSGNTFSFAGITDDTGYFTIVATYQGVAYTRQISVKKTKDGSAAFRGSAALSATGTIGSGTSLGSFSTPIPGGSTVTVSGFVNYTPPQSGSSSADFIGTIYLYYQNVTANGPLVLLGSAPGSTSYRHNNGTPAEPDIDQQSGTASASFAFAAAVGDTVYSFSAILVSNPAGNPYTITASGSLKAEVTS